MRRRITNGIKVFGFRNCRMDVPTAEMRMIFFFLTKEYHSVSRKAFLFSLLFILSFAMLGIKPRALCLLGKLSTTEILEIVCLQVYFSSYYFISSPLLLLIFCGR